jgi:kynurenine formamidase
LPSPSASASGPASGPSSGGASDRPNVPLPDELFAIRTEIKRLTEREAAIKAILISDPDTREGASYLAEVKTVKAPRTDLKELKAQYPQIVEEHTYMLEQTRVVLMGVTEDGELVSPRKLKAAC